MKKECEDTLSSEFVKAAEKAEARGNGEYGHALRALSSLPVGAKDAGWTEESLNRKLRNNTLIQIKLFGETGRKLYDQLPEKVKNLITEEDLRELGI